MSGVLANGPVAAGDVIDGEGFTLVAVGAYPGLTPGPWWHALTYALVRSDP